MIYSIILKLDRDEVDYLLATLAAGLVALGDEDEYLDFIEKVSRVIEKEIDKVKNVG